MSVRALRAVRARDEEAIAMALGRLTHSLVAMETRCRELEHMMQTESASYEAETRQGLSIEAALEWHGRLEAHQAELRQTRLAIASLEDEWQRTQARLVEARQERKVLDRLDEQRRRAKDQELRRREQHLLDEAAQRTCLTPEGFPEP